MYVLKTGGAAQIPDYIQIRDDNFSIMTHFKLRNLETGLKKSGITENLNELIEMIKKLPVGKVYKIN